MRHYIGKAVHNLIFNLYMSRLYNKCIYQYHCISFHHLIITIHTSSPSLNKKTEKKTEQNLRTT